MPPAICKAGALLDKVPAEDRDLLGRLLDGEPDDRGRSVPATVLAQVVPVSATAVKDHRGKRCVCTRPAA